MKIFVIHRFKDQKQLKKDIKEIKGLTKGRLKFSYLKSSKGDSWKNKARKKIVNAELIIVYNEKNCLESENAHWEMNLAKSTNSKLVVYNTGSDLSKLAKTIKEAYNYDSEFESCFSSDDDMKLEMYKLMISSSESLIERRQKTNAFFITIIGSLITVGGFLYKFEILTVTNLPIVSIYSILALLLCNSWRNLLDNYGKLNTGKFRVIGKLETELKEQIYNAEWIALGKGNRKEKYRSFTETEKYVPFFVAMLFFLMSMTLIVQSISASLKQF